MNINFKYKSRNEIKKDMSEDEDSSENSNYNEKRCWSFGILIYFIVLIQTQTQLFFKLNNKEIIIRIYKTQLIKIGEKINFEFDITKMNFFDHEKEKVI